MVADFEQLLVGLGQVLGHLLDLLRRAHAGHDVLALGVDEVLAVEDVLAGGGVAGEGDAGAGVLAGVAEDHGLHVDGGAPLGGDAVLGAVDLGAVVVPGVEDRVDGAVELLHRVLREALAAALLDELLELGDDPAEVVLLQPGVVGDLGLGLGLVEDHLVGVVVLALVRLDAHDDGAVHLEEAAVAVPGELGLPVFLASASTTVSLMPRLRTVSIMPGHRLAGAGADGEEERVLRSPNFLPIAFSILAMFALISASRVFG